MAVNTKDDELRSWKPADTSGNNYAKMAGMSELHQTALAEAGKRWQAAHAAGDQAGMDAEHQNAESIRALYGYSGGEDGSAYIPILEKDYTSNADQYKNSGASTLLALKQGAGQSGSAGWQAAGSKGFTYDVAAPTFNDSYSARIDALLNQVMNYSPFSYDAERDPTFQQYKDTYTREGQRAMQNTLGQVSARTGGLASSYATSAAQQANNYYMQQLSDKIPELRQLAYEMYVNDYDRQVQRLGLLQTAQQNEYGRYQDELSRWDDNRKFAYGQYWDELNYKDKQEQTGYDRTMSEQKAAKQAVMDLIAAGGAPTDAQLQAAGMSREEANVYTNKVSSDKNATDRDVAYQRAMDFLLSGAMPNKDILQAAGITNDEAAAILAVQKMDGGGVSGNGAVDKTAYEQAVYLYENGLISSEEFMAMTGIFSGPVESFLGGRVKPELEPKPEPVPVDDDTLYEDAVKTMTDNGVDQTKAANAMTRREWQNRKSAYNRTGVGGEEVKLYDTYEEYIADYIQYTTNPNG